MGSRRSARLEARELVRELELSEGVQAQLIQDAQKDHIRKLKTSLKEKIASNQEVEELNASLCRQISTLKANYFRIIYGLEIRQKHRGREMCLQLFKE